MNPQSPPRQHQGACLLICPGLWAAFRLAPLSTPTWPTPASQQGSVLTRRQFLSQVLETPEPSWYGCGHPAPVTWRPNLRPKSWWSSHQQLTASEPRSGRCDPLTKEKAWVFTPHFRRTIACGCWWRIWAKECLRAPSGRSWRPWTFASRESCSSDPAAATRILPRTVLPPPLHCVCGTRSRGDQSAFSHRPLRSAGHGGDIRGSKVPTRMQALPALRPYAAELWIRSSGRRVRGVSPLWWLPGPTGTASVLQLRGQPHGELPWMCQMERGEGRACNANTWTGS